ncbi:MAG TPA: Asp-tRNA(Asn)/Glu-tRNA(Gln) amidotransferase GatCAB subunit C, partial [Chitinophagaceae bacterium]|nr:Asp-tRNA(Asn)/Glu-tRNA(Gln) amidotransferase GatCAB subunit C [Chitinophagaceae bacterium]
MEVTPTLVQQLAQLSKLYFTPEEMVQVQQDLSQMISFVDQLSAVDT